MKGLARSLRLFQGKEGPDVVQLWKYTIGYHEHDACRILIYDARNHGEATKMMVLVVDGRLQERIYIP